METLLTASEVATHLSISPQTLANWRTKGRYADELPHLKMGRSIRYRESAVEKFKSYCETGS